MDIFFALSIFCVLLIIIAITLNNYGQKSSSEIESDIMITKAFQISDLLIKTEGFPSKWNNDNIEIAGLASSDRVISEEKLSNFTNLSINKTKSLLKTQIYNFYLTLKKVSGENITKYGKIPSGKKTVSIRRYVLFKNESAILDFSLWR